MAFIIGGLLSLSASRKIVSAKMLPDLCRLLPSRKLIYHGPGAHWKTIALDCKLLKWCWAKSKVSGGSNCTEKANVCPIYS